MSAFGCHVQTTAAIKALKAEIAQLRGGLQRSIALPTATEAARNVALEEEVGRLRAELDAKQARIDELMLEYEPEAMTDEQVKAWGAAQAPVPEKQTAVRQFRKKGCSDWYDGLPDEEDGRGPYESRTLYAAPVPSIPPGTLDPLYKLLDYADESDSACYSTLSTRLVRDLVNEALAAAKEKT
jgi:hypothetical protein